MDTAAPLATGLAVLRSQQALVRATAVWFMRVEQAGAARRDSPVWDVQRG